MRELTKAIAAQTAYLIGVRNDFLDMNYKYECGDVIEEIRKNDTATAIRILCQIRTTMLQYYESIGSRLKYDLKNIDTIELFNSDNIRWLTAHNIPVLLVNSTIDDYIIHINKLLNDLFPQCGIYPEWVNISYIRDLFIMPYTLSGNYEKAAKAIWDEKNKFLQNQSFYPYQMYIHWQPTDCGYFLSTDRKFLTVLYRLHDDEFYDNNKVMDANSDIKNNIYQFIDEHDSVVIAVDCENSDVYKLYSVLHNLNPEKLEKIKKIILYDDYHTTNVWKLLEKLIDIQIEYNCVERVTDGKSLVDIYMTAGVCREVYENHIDAFILVSSDSDFWGLISSLSHIDFLVMVEYEKCGEKIKQTFRENGIYYCSIDDFCRGNIEHIKNLALKTELNERLNTFNTTGIWGNLDVSELIYEVFKACRIELNKEEEQNFKRRYLEKLRFGIDKDGKFNISLSE